MTSMSMDELDECDVLRLSLWFVSIVSLLHFFCSALNAISSFKNQNQNGKCCQIVTWSTQSRERYGFVHCFYIGEFEIVYLTVPE